MKFTIPVMLSGMMLVCLVGGCTPGQEEPFSKAEMQRRTVDPKVASYLVNGQRAYEMGNYTLALAYTDSAEFRAPQLADLHFLRGVIYTQLNQLDIAAAAFETVLEIDPAYQGVHFNMGLNASRRGKLRDAIDLFKAEEALGGSSALMLELGRAYARMGEPDSARMAYEQAIVLDDSNATAYMWLGQQYEEIGELDLALEYSRKGLALAPGHLDYQYIIGSLLNRKGEADAALAYLQPIADQRPWHHGAQYNLGQVYMRLGQEEDAQRYFARADSAQQLQQKVNEAQETINRDPETIDNWINLAELLKGTGQLDKAIEAYKVVVSMTPWNMHLQNNLALMMMDNGDIEGSIRRYRSILRIDSTLADVWINLGVAYANDGNRLGAQAAWERALVIQPGHPGARTLLTRLDEIHIKE